MNYIARWDGSTWHSLGSGLNLGVNAVTEWDPDGDGPEPTQLVASGAFTTAGSITVNRIARWDGSQWSPLGAGMNSTVNSLRVWDRDGNGPEPAQLVAAGSFTTAGGVSVNRIARWDGSAWHPFGSGLSDDVSSLTLWDPDAGGPEPAQLVAAMFSTTGAGRVVRWDGSAWNQLGSQFGGMVRSLTVLDPDGDGPEPAQLVAGGSFTAAAFVTVNRIARWDGAEWRSIGVGFDDTVVSLTPWDPDGDGPEPAQLVAGGSFTTAGGVVVNRVARWDGSEWYPVEPVLNSVVSSVTMWDPDGDGPEPAQLVAGGTFTSAGGVAVNRVARWDGSAWRPFGSGLNDSPSSLTAWDPDGDGPAPAQLVAGGLFTSAGGGVRQAI